MSAGTPLIIGDERVVVIGRNHCLIRSRSNPGQYHALELDKGDEVCTCIGFTVRKSCRHAKCIRDWRLGKIEARLDVDAA